MESKNNGIGFIGLLTIVLVLLKAFNYIAWSWFWVFSPVIFYSIFIFGLIVLYVILKLTVK
jgi:hypothetical protein